jgi:glucose-6-phosphate 1-dehydrogenase
MHAPEPCALVIFGATGDLAARKLLPALCGLWVGGFLPEALAIVGIGRRAPSEEQYRADVANGLQSFRRPVPTREQMAGFLSHVYYQAADFTTRAGMENLATRLRALDQPLGLQGRRLFYLATDPDFFATIADLLTETGLIQRDREQPWARVVFEKPFGHDLASAKALNFHLLSRLREDQVYRIDHYLGKETVQNLLAFRFGNAIFEPIFNRELVEHVQVTVAETVGMEGRRGSYYDGAGALRDVAQNHLLQILALIAMEPPATLRAADISDAKLKVLRDLLPLEGDGVARRVVRGQYGGGTLEGKHVPAYREEEGVAATSVTETYVAIRAELESWRWAGVPFLLRTGKRLARRVTEVSVHFRLPPLRLFRTVECEGDACDLAETQPNVLTFRIQPDEGIELTFSAKRPGMQLDLQSVLLDFDYDRSFPRELPEAYERLLFDALRGDATLFMRTDELEAAWEYVTPILDAWRRTPASDFPNYAPGAWGPAAADRLAEGCTGGWRRPMAHEH